MPPNRTVICPSCGFKNPVPVPKSRCASCGAKIEDLRRTMSHQEELARRYQQEGFSVRWFLISIVTMAVLTTLFLYVVPEFIPVFDFEGQAGMMIAIPIWFVGGFLIGLISPGRTFIEPVVAAFLVAIPTAVLLFKFQTVKTMPAFMYVLMTALGLLFTLVGAYAGERVQMGPASPDRKS